MDIYIMVIVAGIILIFIWAYNRLIAKKNAIQNNFGAIDAVLKKRYDLIPNLIAAVQEYMRHEQETLKHITELRTQAINSGDIKEKLVLNEQMSDKIQTIFVSAESYPELKSSQNMLQLQQALTETEGQISAARRTYNQTVTNYNNACEQIPTNIIAALLRYKPQEILDIPHAQRSSIDLQKAFQQNNTRDD